jgi:photosystem II stability/assembly factor-like uncharacterized protein
VSKPLIGTLVALFLVVDTVLGLAVWRHMNESGGNSGVVIDDPVTAPIPSGPIASAESAGEFQKQDPSTATLMGAASDGTVVVATAGTCGGGGPSVLVSSDSGTTLTPAKPGISRALSVQVQSDGSILLIGADVECKATGLSSRDVGESWADAPIGGGWYLDPESPTAMVSPAGSVDVGCTVMGFSAPADDSVRVLCDDGTLVTTADDGKTWSPMAGVKAARAVSFVSATSGVVLEQTSDCAARAFVTADGGDTWDRRGCVGGQQAQSVLDQGKRMLSVVDAKVFASSDGGLTWQKP